MKWKEIKSSIGDYIAKFFVVLVVIAIIFGVIRSCTKKEQVTPPVERYEIDSLIKENDKIIIEVEHLDSIKNAKVIEVKSLDNDSTLRLFYQLIGK